MSRIGLVTCAQIPDLTGDDRLALAELQARGHEVRAVVWSDDTVAWKAFDAIVLRSCWDYHWRPDEFTNWLDELERAGANLQNPVPTARWNMEKTYLRDLQQAGIATVPTRWIEPGTFRSLAALRDETGWTDMVLKPAVSATAWQLWRAPASASTMPEEIRQALDARRFLAQPFVGEIERGEWSLVFFDNRFSHAVLKQPRDGDFRVQEDYGGRSAAASPPAGFVEAGERILATLPEQPLYARVDGVDTSTGFMLLELELLEPVLFLAKHADAASRFADAIERRS
jgi:glutathione synthase/RimK-type ligase-like ATP-grasp enzyme